MATKNQSCQKDSFYMLKRWFQDKSGQGLSEYGLIIALIAVIAVTAIASLGKSVQHKLCDASTAIAKAGSSDTADCKKVE